MEPSPRDMRFDNLKGIMILLVVFCHFIEYFDAKWTQQSIVRWLYCCIYSFHMPVFIFCSGYFSKGTSGQSDSVKRAITGCFVPYFAFQVIYGFLFFKPSPYLSVDILEIFNFTMPQWTLWYLLSLFFWRIFAEPFSMLRWPLTISLALSVYIGATSADNYLSISRTFAFFPFFLAGYMFSPSSIEKIRTTNHFLAAGAFIAAMAVMSWFNQARIGIGYLRMNQPYSVFNQMVWEAMLLRMLVLTIGFVCIFSLMVLVTERRTILAAFGKHSLPIYLFHSALIRLLARSGWIHVDRTSTSLLFAALFALAVCFLFGNEPIHNVCASLLRSVSRILLNGPLHPKPAGTENTVTTIEAEQTSP